MRILPLALSAGSQRLLAVSLGGMMLHFYCMPPSAICSATPAGGSIFHAMGTAPWYVCPWIFSAAAALSLIGIGSARAAGRAIAR